VQRVYGPLVEYLPSPCVMLARLSADTPGAYEKWMNKAIGMVPGFRHELGNFFASRGRDAEAEATFDTWLTTETDDVLLSNSVEWLVEYKEGKGDSEGATAVAESHDETGGTGVVESEPKAVKKSRAKKSKGDEAVEPGVDGTISDYDDETPATDENDEPVSDDTTEETN